MPDAFGSSPPDPWPRRAGLGLALLASLAAGYVLTRPRAQALRPLAEVVPGQAFGVEPTALESALPPNAAFVAGALQLPQSWAALQATQFFQTLAARAPAGFGDPAALARFFGPRAILGYYTGLRPEWVVLAEAAPHTTVSELRSFLPAAYAARVGDVWVLSSSARLGAEAAERLAAQNTADEWLAKALARMPARSAFYGVMNFEALRPLAADKAVAWDRKQPWLWAGGGLYVDNGLRGEQFAAPRPNAPSLFRDPPRALGLPFPRGEDAAVFAAFVVDLRRVWREYKANLTPEQKKTMDKALENLRKKWDFERRLIPFLGDQAGLYIGRNPAGSILPPAAVFVRLRHGWFFRLGAWRALKKAGWKRQSGLWIYAAGGGLVPADIALAFHKGFALLGTREGVEALRRPSTGSGTLSQTLGAIGPPEAVSAVFAVDTAGVVGSVSKSYAAWRPRGRGERGPDWTSLFGLIPPYAGYSVNVEEGSYSKTFVDLRDRPAAEWRRAWDRLLPAPRPASARGVARPLARAEPRRVRVESGRAGTSISIRGAVPRAQSGDGLARSVSGNRASLLRDADWMVRRDAARALGDTGTAKDIPALTPLLKDRRPEVRAAAQSAIQKLGRKKPPAKKG